MKKKVKIILAAVIAVGVGAAMVWSGMQPTDVATVKTEPKEAYAYFIEDGTVSEGTDFMLFPEVSGSVLRVTRKKGDFVNKGDVIVQVDKTDYGRQLAAHEANINSYLAQIAGAKDSEQDAKDGYRAQIASLQSQLSQIEAQRKTAEAARLSLPTATEQLELLQVTIDKIKTDITLSEETLRKQELLYQAGVTSKAVLDEAQNALDASRAALRQYETEYAQTKDKTPAGDLAQVGEAEFYASQKRAANEQIAELSRNLGKDYSAATESYYNSLIDAEGQAISGVLSLIEKCDIKSPVSGYLTDFPAEGLSAVSPAQLIAVIKTEGDVKIEAYVSTKDIGVLKVEDQVELVLKGRDEDKTFTGKIEEISKWAESKTTALGLDEKKVRVIISAEDASELLPGSDLDIKFTVFREQNKILVPTSAIFTSDGMDHVFTINGGKAVKTQVTKGVKTLTETVIESGLGVGETVIVEANTEGLKEGARVRSK